MRTPSPNIFFVGFLNDIPKGLRVFLPVVSVVLICLFAAVGYVAGASQDDPGDGRFRFDLGRQEVTGVVQMTPYPTLTVVEGNDLFPVGHVLMLAGQGKRGAMFGAMADGKLTTVRGVALTRGKLDMLQVAGRNGSAPAEGAAPPVAPDESLGRWRLVGEICDGKCLAGAMRPGIGLAHKACANLCLIGDIPPVFAATAPVDGKLEGSEFLLVAGPDGGPMDASLLDDVGALIEIEGKIMRRGDLLIFHAEPATVRVL